MTDFLNTHWIWLAAVIDVTLATTVTIHAVLWKRDSRAVIAWVGLAWLAPLVGGIFYFWIGINRIERRATALRLRRTWRDQRHPTITQQLLKQEQTLEELHPDQAGLIALGRTLTRRPVLAGNTIEPLRNGDEAYPAMLAAIKGAQRSVSLLSYIFDCDRAGLKFQEALQEAHARGVEVRVLIDDVGSRYSRPNMVDRLQAAGLQAERFLPTRIPRLLKYANLRNHRKILVVDGIEGFAGGTNIREGHILSLSPAAPVQCLHFRLTGPVVTHLQEAFAIDWVFATGESLAGPNWFPEIPGTGAAWARGITHGPDEDFEKLVDVITGALAVARRRVRIITPYFLPDSSLIKSLCVTAMRGVAVEVIVPARNNIPPVQWASMAQLWPLLERHCRVYAAAPPFDHTKLMIVDDVWSLIGSSNWDPRSFRLNFEFNVECYDEQFAALLNSIFTEKLASAREITREAIAARPFPIRLRDGLARLFSPYM